MPLDQADALVQIDTLTKNLATANASLLAVTGERDAAKASLVTVNASLVTANASVATVTGERDTARASLVTMTAERDALKGTQAEFDKKLAGELAKHGVRPSAIATNSGAKTGDDKDKGMTMTEISAAVKAGTMTKEEAAAMRPKTEPAKFKYGGKL